MVLRRTVALTLLGALPALSGVIPVLDVMVGDGRAAVESGHIPGTHGFAHDHFICIQQQANQWAPTDFITPNPIAAALVLPELPFAPDGVLSTQLSLPHSRAPPTH